MKFKQQYTNSCGAASLLCAAQELGVETLPCLDAQRSREPLIVSPRSETTLYSITSGQVTGGRVKDGKLSEGGYSMPHNVGLAARELGLEVQFYMSGLIASGVSAFYPDAELNCKRAGFAVIHSEPPPLAANRRALKIMTTFVIGLHYVMQRPDGSYMDPGDGKDFKSFEEMNAWSKMYKETGIVLVLEKPVLA